MQKILKKVLIFTIISYTLCPALFSIFLSQSLFGNLDTIFYPFFIKEDDKGILPGNDTYKERIFISPFTPIKYLLDKAPLENRGDIFKYIYLNHLPPLILRC